ncbi:hypothetical protein BIY29_07360 [Brenneria alni]|uniref:Uncharacterized protein n=1 Tax=Brenneria alni TaxID=71656 RepID=A0A421DQ55_9GAMM|nr:phage tail protein [Brenneria alni]RLM25322.1 hypothetical protein BIY29_07360 [Brenneria alni]
MANLPEKQEWIDGIYQLETSDPVVGGPGGVSNRQAEQLADRTAYLKKELESTGEDLQAHIDAADPHKQYAPKANPALTGTPTAPTAAAGVNNAQIATTAYVMAAIAALVNGSPGALDTLKELAGALGDDPNFSTTVLNKLAQKLEKEQNGADIPDKAKFMANVGLKSAATRAVGSAASDIPDITVGDGRYLGKTATAAAATKLAAARKIAGVAFDGTADIALTPANVGALATTGGTLTGQLISTVADALRLINVGYGAIFRNDGSGFYILLTNKDAASGAFNSLRPLRINLATGDIEFGHTANASVLQEKGQRVYSPNNKPTAADIGALATTGGTLTGEVISYSPRSLRMINGGYGAFFLNDGEKFLLMLTDKGNEKGDFNTLRPLRVYLNTGNVEIDQNLKIGGILYEKNQRVYSPNNKPTAADVGAIGADELTGIPLPYPSATAPAGWLKCNGQAFDKAKYPKLAALYSSGKLPDLRGEFIRGWDDERGVDASRVILSAQSDAMQPITAGWTIDDQTTDTTYPPSGALYFNGMGTVNYDAGSDRTSRGAKAHFDSSRVTRTASETRPRNIAFNYIVRAA